MTLWLQIVLAGTYTVVIAWFFYVKGYNDCVDEYDDVVTLFLEDEGDDE
jgi:hypothetical protein